MLSLKVLDKASKVKAEATGEDAVFLVYNQEFEQGDVISLEADGADSFLSVMLDDTKAPSFHLLKGNRFDFPVPFGEEKTAYSPRAFALDRHLITAKIAGKEEIASRKNLALNPWDLHQNKNLFPHISANAETRGESVFCARNVIDGIVENHGHGEYPFTSWGVDNEVDAQATLHFGRKVRIDEIVLYLRADFPHDAWWETVTFEFSDGTSMTPAFARTDKGQSVKFEPKETEWVIIKNLVKAEDPSPFPALSQWEIYGHDCV